MTSAIRMAGWGRIADGALVTWTVAEGRKGRRWREVVSRHDGGVEHALLLETAPGGRFSHLELARADGLWTFHPEADGTLHGNHVGPDGPGVRHFAGRPFGPDDAVIVEGSPLSLAAIAWRWSGTGSDAEPSERTVAGVVIGADGQLRELPDVRIERQAPRRWRVGEGSAFEIDGLGLPVLDDGEIRPLELG
ncbi:MAG: hypothetical protein ABI562_08210 [Chloroflexota bacterium]